MRLPWDEAPSCEHAHYDQCPTPDDNSEAGTRPVCDLPMGDSADGLCNMAGNVWEWVQDEWHPSYSGAPIDGSGWCSTPGCPPEDLGENGHRVIRGGLWNGPEDRLRVTYRTSNLPGAILGNLGGRLVMPR